jgi:Leucine-rich repeat (LRR) protein
MNDDTIFELYKILPIKDILNCSLINKQFYRVTKNETLWKDNIKEVIKFDGLYYESYKFNYGLERVKIGLKYKWSIKELYECTCLNLNDRNIEIIPYQIEHLQNLKRFYMSCNNIKKIPVELCNLNLQELSLSKNKLTSIPSEIGNLKNLEHLWLYSNPFTYLPSEIGNLTNLKYIDIINNRLTHIPDELYQIPGIKIDK